jgi:hypothetical protein
MSEHPTPASGGPVEYLGEEPTPPRRRRGRGGVVAGGAAAVVALGAAGAWGVASFMSGGQEAADVVPADALAYVSLNLDPGGGQKLEAFQTLKKFPALAEKLDSSGNDLRRALVETILDEVDCPGVTFQDDVAPWLGNAMAVAALPGENEPEPVGLLQVTDEQAAADGLATLAGCSPEGDAHEMSGAAFGDGWLAVAETDDKAQAVLDDAASGSLADDADYQRWVEEAGGSGIVTAYVAADAPAAVTDAAAADHELDTEALKGFLDDFEGAAAVVRFDDEALEVETAAGGLPDWTATDGDSGLEELPDTTAVAYGMAVSDTFVQDLIDAFAEGAGDDQVDQFLRQGEQMTGLDLPEDLQALLGDGVAVALDGSADFSAEGMSNPLVVPVGLRITGDPDEIVPALDKVVSALALAGVPEGLVQVKAGDDAVGVALTADRAATLSGDGGLGDRSAFREALPEVDRSGSGLYVGFDDGGWFDSLVTQAADDQVTANVAPLHGLGVTGWTEDGTSHGLLRLTTD